MHFFPFLNCFIIDMWKFGLDWFWILCKENNATCVFYVLLPSGVRLILVALCNCESFTYHCCTLFLYKIYCDLFFHSILMDILVVSSLVLANMNNASSNILFHESRVYIQKCNCWMGEVLTTDLNLFSIGRWLWCTFFQHCFHGNLLGKGNYGMPAVFPGNNVYYKNDPWKDCEWVHWS